MVFSRGKSGLAKQMNSLSAEARRKRKEWRQEHGCRVGSTPKMPKQTEAAPTADGEGTSTQAAESEPSTSAQDLRKTAFKPKAIDSDSDQAPIVDEPLLQSIEFDRIILAPFHVFQGIGNALIKELESSTECAEIANEFFRSIGARREMFRKKDMTGNSIRKVLIHADQLERQYSAEWPQIICQTLGHLAKIQTFTKAQPLSPRDLDELETSIDQFRTFLNNQPRMRTLLALKPKVHLLLNHFVPFARQHQFLALLDEQGDEALHSVWRRLEQLWKTMPDEEQMRQLLEHHFVSNWLLDTGKIDEMKRDREEQREEIGDRRETDEESDGEEEQFNFE
ncbi:hypothetical protein niasHT_018299 [Heterodera trifolii]|uniref:Uncharacterized protein n=1 Tax=Heterodera trifolii TaxID=157864 RepID=A0ABD2KYM1_9BILA